MKLVTSIKSAETIRTFESLGLASLNQPPAVPVPSMEVW